MAEKHFNAAGTHVLVYNPETDARWESPVDYLDTALKRGWELAEPVDEDAAVEAEHDAEPPKPAKKATARKSSKSGD